MTSFFTRDGGSQYAYFQDPAYYIGGKILPKSNTKKILFTIIGTISLALGIIGIILPILPTAPFLVFSAWCYYRGSEKFHAWLLNHPYLGPIVEEYSQAEGMTKESKIKGLAIMWTAILLTAVFVLDSAFMRGLIVTLGIAGSFFILRVKTRKINDDSSSP